MEQITFSASLPNIQSSISIGQDGARVKLDIPESDIAAVMQLVAYGREKALRVTINDDDLARGYEVMAGGFRAEGE